MTSGAAVLHEGLTLSYIKGGDFNVFNLIPPACAKLARNSSPGDADPPRWGILHRAIEHRIRCDNGARESLLKNASGDSALSILQRASFGFHFLMCICTAFVSLHCVF